MSKGDFVKMIDLKGKKDALVVKSNSILEARFIEKNPLVQGKLSGALSPREMDLLTVLFTTIEKDSEDIRTVRIKISDLIEVFGLSGNSAYKNIAVISRKLLSRVIEVYDKEEKSLSQFQILSKAKYFHGEGYAEYRFNEELKPHLLNLKQYAKFMIENSLILKSFYSKRVYELIIQYKNTHKQGKWQRQISISDLKSYLGIKKEEYARIDNFKTRVLNPSIKEITEKTDINLNFEFVKQGRTPTDVLFIAEQKTVISSSKEAYEDKKEDGKPSENMLILIKNGLSEKQATIFAEKYEFTYIQYVLKKLEQAKKKEEIENPSGWLYAILSVEGFKSEYNEDQEKIKSQKNKKSNKELKNKLSEKIEKVKRDYREYYNNLINSILLGYSSEAIIKKQSDFIQFLEAKNISSFVMNQAKKEYWNTKLVYAEVKEFFEKTEGVKILNIEEFAERKGVFDYKEMREKLHQVEKEEN